MSRRPLILIVDDEPMFLETMQRILEREGMNVVTAASGRQALQLAEQRPVDVALVDVVMPEMNGVEFLRRVRTRSAPPEVVMLTAHATIDTAVEAMKLGAYDYLQKPADVTDVERVLRRAFERRQLSEENQQLRSRLRRHDPYGEMVGQSPPMSHLRDLIERVAPSGSTVLILGESGVGKELVARIIHERSERADSGFHSVNCGALRSSLLENELFGHVAGAFTGATKSARGLFEAADGGTLFIDEIGEMPLDVQAAVLRVIETGEFKRLGETATRRTDVRIVAATNRDLELAVREGDFRKDLFYRLDVFSLTIPPLRERRSDIPLLAEYLIRRIEPDCDPPPTLSGEALSALQRHDWPGNVRELRNALERGLILASGGVITPDDLPAMSSGGEARTSALTAGDAGGRPADDGGEFTTLDELERRQIRRALGVTKGNKTAAAGLLGVSVRSLYTRLRRLGLREPGPDPKR